MHTTTGLKWGLKVWRSRVQGETPPSTSNSTSNTSRCSSSPQNDVIPHKSKGAVSDGGGVLVGKRATSHKTRRALGFSLAVGFGAYSFPDSGTHTSAASAAPASSVAPLEACLYVLQSARQELEDLEQSVLFTKKLNVDPDYKTLRQKLKSGSLGQMRQIAVAADDYIGESNLSSLDEKVWNTMMPNEAGRSLKVPWGPNALLCTIFSCYSDPRQAASTDLLLTQKVSVVVYFPFPSSRSVSLFAV